MNFIEDSCRISREEIDRRNQIITDLLSLVRMDKKAADLNIEMVNINDLLGLVIKRLKPIAEETVGRADSG